ncbi:hypothetical protein AGRA3207_005308 [Actinomadura graeca]|uniref:Transcriptional regulator n=1 Tax=Actinomadura graeca TaxID=2750812 RepID=A0ABX8R2X9_9ACTN|nr:hypothetical protein [Actinomadura graeca]QXJ24057.1 hypothetical protein AGRA3207_005308 [Actinomadura graeca]
MDAARRAGAQGLRRLRDSRGLSWGDLAKELRTHACRLRIARIATAQLDSVRRAIARWEAGVSPPDERYQLLLAHVYARSPLGVVALGPGSDFEFLLETLALFGIGRERLEDLRTTVAVSVTDTGTSLLAFLAPPLRNELAGALSRPDDLDLDVVDGLVAATAAVDEQIGSVPFVRLHLAHAAVVDACRQLLLGEQADPVRTGLQVVAGRAFALAARLAFETRDDVAALALYEEAVAAVGGEAPSHRALIRSSQTMVVFYSTGDIGRARRISAEAVQDARRGESVLMRARAHALQAEMAVRGHPSQRRHAQAALHLAWHDLDADTTGDPMEGAFSKGRLHGFEGICGIYIGEAAAAEQQLAKAAEALARSREVVQRCIVLTDRAVAQLHTGEPGAPEAAAGQLHECVDITAATRGRVPAQRLRQARMELSRWRTESFVAALDDHIHERLIGV